MAEYIYWTGDEKNVALMIEQFLQKGLISRQEAINFLQSIKLNLDFMEARDKNLQKFDKKSLLNAVYCLLFTFLFDFKLLVNVYSLFFNCAIQLSIFILV